MVKNVPTGFRLAAGLLVSLALVSSGLAQTMYVEGFDDNGPTLAGDHGPINLIGAGWTFSNQSEPLGWSHWTDNLLISDPPQAGPSCLGASVYNVDDEGIISNWAILPDVG